MRDWSILRLLNRIWQDSSVRSASLAFLITRFIILLLFVLTAQLELARILPDGSSTGTRLDLTKADFSLIVTKRVTVGDANWYIGIAAYGYDVHPFTTNQQANWAFFPLFPLLLRTASKVSGEFALTGVLLSSLIFFAALILLHKTAMQFGLQPDEAGRTVLYLAAFPVSYFFSLPVSESLFLLLTVGCFYAATRERWWLAGITGALASATRITGVLLVPALAVLYWQTYQSSRRRFQFLWLLLIPSGLLLFMYFLHSITGNPLAFKDIMIAWGREPSFFLIPLIDYLRQPLLLASGWDFRIVNFLALASAIICGLGMVMWRWWSLALYTLMSLFVTLSSGLLQSQARYTMVLFPVYMVLARLGSNNRVHQTILTVSLILLTAITILFCYKADFALS